DALRRLQHELELGGHIARPCFENRWLRHAIERVVDFDRPKPLTIKMEHLFVRKVLGIKRALPLLVRIPAGADVEVHTLLIISIQFANASNNSTRTSESFRPVRAGT